MSYENKRMALGGIWYEVANDGENKATKGSGMNMTLYVLVSEPLIPPEHASSAYFGVPHTPIQTPKGHG